MSTSGQFENMICEAIETLVDRAVEKANYDKTIQASIVEQVDVAIGKYKVKYQDSTFFAYAADVNAKYSKGTNVYVLIPSNDMEKDKTIIGAVEKLGTDYIPTVPEKNRYDEVGSNFIKKTENGIGVCSYRNTKGFSFLDSTALNPKEGEGKDSFLIYDSSRATNYISLIAAAQIEKYMRDSSYLMCGATFKTSLKPEQAQDTSGIYGIEFELTFKNEKGEKINKVYRIDNNDMEGYPYHYEKGSAQRIYFPIDGKNFIEIKRIQLFCAKFPKIDDTQTEDDIFAFNLLLQGANKISEEDLNGYYLTLTTPQGEFLGTDEKDEISLVANLRAKGQNIGSDPNVFYYWFRENPKITRESDLFHLYGGLGWECLNKNTKDVINSDGTHSTVTDLTRLGNTFVIKNGDIKSKYATYKCVAVYNGNSFSAEKTLQNIGFDYSIELVTDTGQTVFNGIGTPTIICNIYDSAGKLIENPTNNFDFSWAQINSNGQFTSLSTQDSKVKINMNQILTFATYKCAVYTKKEGETGDSSFVGSASILLKNEDSQEVDLYSLVINNGSKIFKYNEAGVSPASSRLDNPMVIPELSFTLYNPEGQEVTSNLEDTWYFPIKNTMLKLNYGEETPPVDDEKNPKYYVITKPKEGKISYSIADTYDPSKTNNTIRLSVKVGDTTYTETTTFLFVREGDSGTNGTDYVLRILPNVSEKNAGDPLIPILTKSIKENAYLWNYTLKTDREALKLQIWKSEDLIYEGTDFGDISLMDVALEEGEVTTTNATLKWENLIHKYSESKQDISYINLSESSGKAHFIGNFSDESDPANIIQARVSYDGAFFSATLPIITAEVPNTNYRIILKEGSGFTSVVYSADGMFPQYNKNTPFEVIVEKKDADGKWIQKFDNSEKFKYNWSIKGKINEKNKISEDPLKYIYEDYLKESKKEKKDNQYWTVPVERCSAECLSIAVYCEILNEDNSAFGWIHIPIHFMLNRYGQAALNGWDGNSVDINKEGGYILSPQIGAGKKEDNNSFSGIFMGEVKEYTETSEISHNGIIGYHHGIKSLFLNAEDGSAIFGKFRTNSSTPTGGQIIIDPSKEKALLYSSNFFIKYDNDGKPTSTEISNESKQGLLIDLTTPEIRYGNEKFSVNSEGYLTAKSGKIAGWNIGENSLYHDGYTVGMGAFNRVYSSTEEDHDDDYGIQVAVQIADSTKENGYKTENKAVAFWAGGILKTENNIVTLDSAKTFLSHDGYFKTTEAIIGAGPNPIFIGKSVAGINSKGENVSGGESAIYNFKKNNFSGAPAQKGFYLGESGLAIGTHPVTQPDGITIINYNAFEVNNEGKLIARKGYIGDGANGWEIGAEALVHNKKTSMFMGKGKPFIENPYLIKDGTYLGVDGFELGFSQLDLKYKVALPSEEDGEEPTVITKQKQIYAPGFWVKRGAFSTTSNESGQVGINRGILAGTWDISEEGIVSTKYNQTNVNSYLGESSPNLSYSETIPMPSTDGYLTAEDGSQIKISTRTHMVKLLSFCLPNQIDRAIGLWGEDGSDDENFAYSYQRIVAGRALAQPDSRLSAFGAKKWAWELMDDGSMYARRAVISTNFYKTFDLPEKDSKIPTDGVYIGPEGLCIGKLFAIDKTGTIMRGGQDHYYTTKIAFNNNGFDLTFTNGKDSYTNNFSVTEDSQGRITKITNTTNGKIINVTYN